jgi:hypothetical protein
MRDAVGVLLEQWRTERPDLDPSPMGVIGRISRASRLLDRDIKVSLAAGGVEPWEFDVLATLRRARKPHSLAAVPAAVGCDCHELRRR